MRLCSTHDTVYEWIIRNHDRVFFFYFPAANAEYRYLSSVSNPKGLLSLEKEEENKVAGHKNVVPLECRFVYPEFLPDPRLDHRNSLREKLERMDMMNRRNHIDIPEFYVGKS